MIKTFFVFAILCVGYFPAKADLGSCVVYQAKFYLKNGDSFNGSWEVSGYGEEARLNDQGVNQFCNDESIITLFKKIQQGPGHLGKIPVYKNFRYISFHRIRQSANANISNTDNFGYVHQDDIVWLDSSDILKMVFWSAEMSKRDWVTSRIIIGSPGMLDTIVQQRYWNEASFKSIYPGDRIIDTERDHIVGAASDYILVNYNANINTAELKRLAVLKLTGENERLGKMMNKKYPMVKNTNYSEEQMRSYYQFVEQMRQERVRWFWERGIVIVQTNETC